MEIPNERNRTSAGLYEVEPFGIEPFQANRTNQMKPNKAQKKEQLVLEKISKENLALNKTLPYAIIMNGLAVWSYKKTT